MCASRAKKSARRRSRRIFTLGWKYHLHREQVDQRFLAVGVVVQRDDRRLRFAVRIKQFEPNDAVVPGRRYRGGCLSVAFVSSLAISVQLWVAGMVAESDSNAVTD